MKKHQISKYQILEKIGSGSFGEVFLGKDNEGNKVAVKMEPNNTKIPQLLNESRIYSHLQKSPFVPTMHYFGSNETHNILVTQLLGPSLEAMFNKHDRKFDIPTILVLSIKLLDIIQNFHENNYIHRDIKPENFLFDNGNVNKIFIIDYGLSKKYRSSRTHEHIKYSSGKSLVGTPRYASLNNHIGNELSRRDDLESIGYMIIYFMRGSLPWQGLKSSRSEKYMKIYNKKNSVPLSNLCDCPIKNELVIYMEYVKNLRFEDSPNYSYLKGIFYEAIKKFEPSSIFSSV